MEKLEAHFKKVNLKGKKILSYSSNKDRTSFDLSKVMFIFIVSLIYYYQQTKSQRNVNTYSENTYHYSQAPAVLKEARIFLIIR